MNIKKLFRNDKVNILINYSFVKYIALIIGFVKGIVNARSLGPELLGLLGNLLLVLSYLSYSNFGILYSMNREYVIYESNNDMKSTKGVIRTSFTALLILSLMLLITGVCAKFIYKGNIGTYLLLIFIIGILEQYKSFYINYFRLVNSFKSINYIELINNLVSFILIILTIKYFEIYSVLIALIIADFWAFAYGYKNSEKIKLGIEKKLLRNLISIGFPLLIYNLGFYILTTVDRLMIIKYLGYKDLGYYTFSNQIVVGTLVFITSVLFLYYPKAIKNLNTQNNNNAKEISLKTDWYTKCVEVFGVVLCLVGEIIIFPFVNIVVPEYNMSINIYRILVFGAVANQLSYFSNVFIVSNKKQNYLIYLQIIAVIIAIVFNLIFIKLGMGIIGVSVATLITNAIYSVMQYVIYLRILNIKTCLSNILKVYLKFIIYMILSVFISLININFGLYCVIVITITLCFYYLDFINTIKYIKSVN